VSPWWAGLLIGLVLGTNGGVLLMACLVASRDRADAMREDADAFEAASKEMGMDRHGRLMPSERWRRAAWDAGSGPRLRP
jgi:hypothetical protein